MKNPRLVIDRYAHTIRFLRPIQVFYRLYYFGRGKLRSILNLRYPTQAQPVAVHQLSLAPSIPSHQSYFSNNSFVFLNRPFVFGERIDWNETSNSVLWNFNLNYFEFLAQPQLETETGLRLLRDHIQASPKLQWGNFPAPISIRLLFSIRFLCERRVAAPDIDQALYAQAKRLEQNLEFQLLGNHLLENSFALLFAGCYFGDERMFKRGKRITLWQLDEQILPDGGHFELTPMYHQLMLYRLLDAINLIALNRSEEQSFLTALRQKAALMLGWLQHMTLPDGNIPLFNDSAFHINPDTQQLLDYARRLDIAPNRLPLAESGYRRWDIGAWTMIADVGGIGASYVPGHVHCDMLSFVLSVEGQPYLVDTGTSNYENIPRRWQERGTSAHNTVQVGDLEQSETWERFRVARRAKMTLHEDQAQVLTAEHNGFRSAGATHRRRFTTNGKELFLEDYVGKSGRVAKAYFHFHPDLEPQIQDGGAVVAVGKIAFRFIGAQGIELADYSYSPEFYTYFTAKVLVVSFLETLHTTISPISQ